MSWGWRATLTVIVLLGLCQMLTMTIGFEESWMPKSLGVLIAMLGFLTFLTLGFTLNLALGVVLPILLWGGRGWRPWQALLPASPFLVTAFGLVPKPW